MLQVLPHVSRLPFLPIRVRGIFSYLLAMKWIISIPMYHQLSNSGEMGVWRIWHPTYGVICDEGEVIKRGTYASSAQRAGP